MLMTRHHCDIARVLNNLKPQHEHTALWAWHRTILTLRACRGRGSAAQVWVEVQHCEERVQLLCTITRAVETHVSILQDELCKVGPVTPCLNLSRSLHARCSQSVWQW